MTELAIAMAIVMATSVVASAGEYSPLLAPRESQQPAEHGGKLKTVPTPWYGHNDLCTVLRAWQRLGKN